MKSHASSSSSPPCGEADATAARESRSCSVTSSASNRMVAASREPRADQILDDLLLAVDGDRAPAGQLGQVDAVTAASEAQLDAVMDQALATACARRPRRRSAGPPCPAPARRRARGARRSRGSCLQDDGVDAQRWSRWRQQVPPGRRRRCRLEFAFESLGFKRAPGAPPRGGGPVLSCVDISRACACRWHPKLAALGSAGYGDRGHQSSSSAGSSSFPG